MKTVAINNLNLQSWAEVTMNEDTVIDGFDDVILIKMSIEIWLLMLLEYGVWILISGFQLGCIRSQMINSQALSLNQKQKLWRQHKQQRFKEMAGDRCALFNYFFNNNDIFKFIKEEDFALYSMIMIDMMDKQVNIFAVSFLGVVLVDRIILNRWLPQIRFKQWRLTANLIKFLVWPFTVFKAVDYYYFQDYRETMFNIQEKYHFGFQDYLNGNNIFERALQVNRLEELLEKRETFDWNGVPELS